LRARLGFGCVVIHLFVLDEGFRGACVHSASAYPKKSLHYPKKAGLSACPDSAPLPEL
jgi:hypothetical protein